MTNFSGILIVVILVVFTFDFPSQALDITEPPAPSSKCQHITINLCMDMPYNKTIMPNLLGNEKQDEAGLEIYQFTPLIKLKCSSDFKFFLCAMYAPECTNMDKTLPPCRSLCESARKGCEPLMKNFGFFWPERMNCARLPETGGQVPCLKKING